MKYYLYVSDTKVDMLFAQIPRGLSRRISMELKLDFKFIALTLKPGTEASTRYGKLGVVVEALRQQGEIGTINFPSRYIEGTESMRWVTVGSSVVWVVRRGSTLVALTGSSRNLTGGSDGSSNLVLNSLSYMALPGISRSLDKVDNFGQTIDDNLVNNVAFINESIRGPVHRLEFVAINQGVENTTNYDWAPAYKDNMRNIHNVILGSPLYVAQA